MEFHGIVAMDTKGAIGFDGKLPWHLPSELKHFKQLTMGHPMVFGRTTFEGFKSPLPGRDHLVLSKTLKSDVDRVFMFSKKDELLKFCQLKKYSRVTICGGASIYELFKNDIDFWHVSEIQLTAKSPDTFFPIDILKDFSVMKEESTKDETTQIPWKYLLYRRP